MSFAKQGFYDPELTTWCVVRFFGIIGNGAFRPITNYSVPLGVSFFALRATLNPTGEGKGSKDGLTGVQNE